MINVENGIDRKRRRGLWTDWLPLFCGGALPTEIEEMIDG